MGDTEVIIDEWGEILAERAKVPDIERLERNQERAARRARNALLDYMTHNRLSKMWTLTNADPNVTREQMGQRVADFFRRWRDQEGKPFPYAYVLEPHPGGHGWHAHIAVQGWLYTDKYELGRMWGWGIVQYDKARITPKSRRDYRRLGSYLAKYLGKTFGDELRPGAHRYEVAEGFAPLRARFTFSTAREALAFLAALPGMDFIEVWSSDRDPKWVGPPSFVYESG